MRSPNFQTARPAVVPGDAMKYQSEKADALEMYVSRTVPLRGPARHLYFALRRLEFRNEVGLCGRLVAPYADLVKEAGIDAGSVKPALLECRRLSLFSHLRIGSPNRRAREATELRRSTLDELRAHTRDGDGDAARLATWLNGRPVRYHGEMIRPTWSVLHTGRVQSTKPNIQGDKSGHRKAGLMAGLQKRHVLVHADVRQAEPTVIKHLLRIPSARDVYDDYQRGAGCNRDEAKVAVNSIAYTRDTLGCFRHWPPAAQDSLRDYVEALAAYKSALFAGTRRTGRVTTCTGRTIHRAESANRRIHAGMPMNWRVQGTVADIINAACLALIDRALMIVPVHDAIYAIVSEGDAGLVAAAIQTQARACGLLFEVRAEILAHPPAHSRAPGAPAAQPATSLV
jgi:hypothetical protein